MPKKSKGEMAEKVQATRGRATERMRRSRQRRRDGLRCYVLQIRSSEIDALVRMGLVSADQQTNRVAVVKGLHQFLDLAFARPW